MRLYHRSYRQTSFSDRLNREAATNRPWNRARPRQATVRSSSFSMRILSLKPASESLYS